MLELGAFAPETVTIELRYGAAFQLWDGAGEIWTRILGRFPELKVQSIAPHVQTFESSLIRASVELEAFRVIARGVKPEKRAAQVSQAMLEICSDKLQLTMFSRLGYRDIRLKAFADSANALNEASAFMPGALSTSAFGSANVKSFQVGINQETDSVGLRTAIRLEDREIKVAMPWEIADKVSANVSPKDSVVILDSDYFTTAPILRDSLNLEDWAKQADRLIAKYWKSVLQ